MDTPTEATASQAQSNAENGISSNPKQQPRLPTHDEHKTAVADAFDRLADDSSLGWGARRSLYSYYSKQHQIIRSMEDMDKVHEGSMDEFEAAVAAEEKHAQRALNYSFISNIILLGVRAAIAAISGSLSLIVALIDAVLDVLSGGLMYYLAWDSRRTVNKYRYPVGKHRMEPLGVIVFSCIMATAAFTIIVEGIKQLVANESSADGLNQKWVVIGGTILMVAMKAVLYFYCRKSKNVAAQAFATDHLNDVIVNASFLSLVVA
jgi:Co/Zn/Cd efflux system component